MSERVRRGMVLVAALAVAALTARLGVWQLDRAAQKIALQSVIDQRRDLPVLPGEALAKTLADADLQIHRRIALQGRWIASATVFLDNRQMDQRVGFFVLTPLRLADGSAVVVQRGWVSRDQLDRTKLPAVPTPDDTVEVVGRIDPRPGRLYELGEATQGRIRQNLDLASFASELGIALRPVSVLQEDGPDDRLLRHWPMQAIDDVSRHRGYAFQWFSLSALVCGLYVWFQLIRPRRRVH
jgi:surfeit locus 1 family protein